MKASREEDNQWASASRAVLSSPPYLGGLSVLWCCQIKGRCASVSITALRSHLPLPGIRISVVWDTVSAKPCQHKGRNHSGMGTGAFVKAVQRGLPGFAVIYVFKIGNEFLRLLTCIPSLLPWLQLSIPAVLTTGAASRTVFSSVRTTTSASASQATS